MKQIGQIGEKTVENHLKRQGFKLIDRNYGKKWGEIDLIMQKDGIVRFIEVKTVTRETADGGGGNVSRGTDFRPEENVHPRKLQKLHRAVETWLSEKEYEGEWQIDVAAVQIDPKRKTGKIKLIENVVL